nr:penicillin-binding protein 1B [Pseudomarimonas arenosa]
MGFLVPYFWAVDRWLQQEFGRLTWSEPTRVWARPLHLRPGLAMTAKALGIELAAAQYRSQGRGAGSYTQTGNSFELRTRAFRDVDLQRPAQQLRLELANGRLRSLQSSDGRALAEAWLDPARIATLYGPEREERRLVRLAELPPTLLAAVQAVEDRSFKHHRGIDFWGILRALVSNIEAGEIRQGASTLTQQLVRNLYLSRDQTWSRKLREAAYSLVIEARFDKARIFEAYLNQVYLGQSGGQAIHGIGAAAEFWFGRQAIDLEAAEIALLVGMIQGPSYYDPRKHPQRATQRRNLVLKMLLDTGVLDQAVVEAAQAAPLGVLAKPQLAANVFPAFLALVQTQLERDYPAERLRGAGLNVLTTLAPSAQRAAEQALAQTLKSLDGAAKGATLEGAVVLTDTGSGEVQAVVGARDPRRQGFDRALQAKRPVGSLLKPFVYLLALAQPGRYHLASEIEDAPITLRVSAGKEWSPDNYDGRSHGWVTLMDALAQSYNQAAVRLGMDIGVDRLVRLIDVLTSIRPDAHPSLLLGAVDLSPLETAQLYQFLASTGQVQPLRAVRGVLDAEGRALSRYARPLPEAERGDAIATRLIAIALQYAARSGTARRLQQEGVAYLNTAGKTGTSNDSRDSWFAGWTGSHLGVVWIGDDQNRPTGLTGGAGAMKVWAAIFRDLPSEPLKVSAEGLESAWLAADAPVQTDPECEGARQFWFVAGYSPAEHRGCTLSRLRDWFSRE